MLDAAPTAAEGGRQQRRHRRRRHSSSALKRHGTPEESTGQGRDGRGMAREKQQQRPQQELQQELQEQELRASDLARMRQVVARLRVATRELEAERAGRADDAQEAQARAAAGGVAEETAVAARKEAALLTRPACSSTAAALQDKRCFRQRPARVTAPGMGQDGGGGVAVAVAENEEEAAVLLRENASLRRRLFGLAAVEQLETRAAREGLLPLTGGRDPGGEMFSSAGT